MTFEQAMDQYEEHFHMSYPIAMCYGTPGGSEEEDIRIIQECIRTNTPVDFKPDYKPGCLY